VGWRVAFHRAYGPNRTRRDSTAAAFVHDASRPNGTFRQHAIYATSFKKTTPPFPLVWAAKPHTLGERGERQPTVTLPPKVVAAAKGQERLLIKVLDAPAGKRVAAEVTIADTNTPPRRFARHEQR